MQDKKSEQYGQLRHISDITFLEESSHLRLIYKGIIIVAALIIALVIWSAFVTITETTKTLGQLVPEGDVQKIQHLEGGIVTKVLVKNGDSVKRGQLIVQLSTEELRSELEQLRSQEISLTLDSARISAFLDNKPADPEAWGKKVVRSKYNPVERPDQIKALLEDQKRLLQAEYNELASKKAGLENTLAQRKEKLVDLKQQREVWERHIKLLIQEFDMYKKLKTNNYISQKDYLTVMRAVNQAQGDGAKLISEIAQAREDIGETENKLKELHSTAHEQALEELSKKHANLLEVHYKLAKLIQRIARSNVRATVDGAVKGIAVFPGNVVKPGGELLEIVPESGVLIGETKVLPREIGYVHKGDSASVKVLTFDYARFGSIPGKLLNISASTFLDQDGNPYYKTKIHLSQQHVGKDSSKRLKAGMTIEADIITGSKTLLEYLLKPIHRAVTESFRER